MAFKLSELDGELGEIINELESTKEMILLEHEEKEYQIWAEPDYLHIHFLDVFVFGAVTYTYFEENEDYELDHDLYVFYSPNGEKTYFEYGSSLYVCVHNYCHFAGIEVENVEGLLCTYILDNGNFLRKKVLTRDKL